MRVFDLDKALARVDGDRAFLQELAEQFVADCPALMSAIRAAIDQTDADARRHAAHTLKGSVAAFDAGPAYEAALQLETMDDAQTPAEVERAYRRLEGEIDRLLAALRALPEPQNVVG